MTERTKNQVTDQPNFDAMLDALSDIQRRKLLVALLDHNPQDDTPVVADSDSESDALEHLVKMNHVHLPKLEDYGFIEWDRGEDEVSKGAQFEEIRPLLELLAAHDDELPPDWV